MDLGLLVSVTPSPDRYSISINTSTPSSGAQLTLEPWKPPKKTNDDNQRMSAFNTLVAIYVVVFPSEAPQLMKYWEIVRDFAASDSAIGYFAMSNLAFYCKLLLISILVIKFIGSCG